MARRRASAGWPLPFSKAALKLARRSLTAGTKAAVRALQRSLDQAPKPRTAPRKSGVVGPTKARRTEGARSSNRAATAKGSLTQGMAFGAGGPRAYRLYQPAGTPHGVRLPLIVMLHGCGQDAASFAASTRMNALAARESFCVLYPEQDRLAHPHACWNWFETRSGRAFGEVATILAAIDQVCALYPIDADKVAVAGLSAGAAMAALAAVHHPGRFKALVMHSGVAPGLAHSALTALSAMKATARTAVDAKLMAAALQQSPAQGVIAVPPLLVIQGMADHAVSPRNGRIAAELWAALCHAEPRPSRRLQRGARHPSVVTDFTSGRRKRVTLCEIDNLGHGWSGGDGRLPFGDNHGPDASRMVWAFARLQFEEHASSSLPAVPP